MSNLPLTGPGMFHYLCSEQLELAGHQSGLVITVLCSAFLLSLNPAPADM